jgi:hypothetical protein
MKTAACICVTALSAVAVATAIAAPTRAEYVAQLNGICKQTQKPLKRNQSAEQRAINQERWSKAARIEARIDRGFARLLQRLAPIPRPAGDEALIGKWLDAQTFQLRADRKFGRALATGNVHRILSALHRAVKADTASEQIIAGYGLDACESP